MGKYLVLWEMDKSKIPIDPKKRVPAWKPIMDMRHMKTYKERNN
jgi:hypothetical protein